MQHYCFSKLDIGIFLLYRTENVIPNLSIVSPASLSFVHDLDFLVTY